MACPDSPPSLRRIALLAVVLVSSCGEKSPPPPAAPPEQKPAALKTMPAAEARALSSKLESFTGARTRVVWTQYQPEKSADPRSNKSGHLLMGLDTGDEKGIHAILAKEDNYTRPLLSADGATILYTSKVVTWDAEDTKHYSTSIMRTDWTGRAPERIADGCAVDTWVDPATHTEWVYAVRDIIPSPLAAMEAKRLVRFPLIDPTNSEVVWDQSRLTPDNMQLSRDGTRACAQPPQSHAGLLTLGEEGGFKKLAPGSWPLIAPDNSHVVAILNEDHRSLSLFSEESDKPWSVDLNDQRDLMRGEVWHPRWSSHPRFITLTGPYNAGPGAEEGSAIGKGGLTSEVFVGKFNDKLSEIETWFRITDNALNDNYPDVWIEGGGKAELAAFSQTHESTTAAAGPAWNPGRDSLLFIWENSAATNTVKLSGGREIDCALEPQRAARYGRNLEMRLDAGTFAPKAGAAEIVAEASRAAMPVTLEFILHIDEPVKGAFATLASIPNLRLSIRDGIINAETTRGIIGIGPVEGGVVHFTAAIAENGYTFTLRDAAGKSATRLSPAKPRANARAADFTFGGISGKGVGISHVAIYARALSADEMHDHAAPLAALAKQERPPALRLHAKLVEVAQQQSPADGSALADHIYEVLKVTEGDYTARRVLVKHWTLLNGRAVTGFPRKPGAEYDLALEPVDAQPQLKPVRCATLEAAGLAPWFDTATPVVPR
ncbi:MAG: hypothetical protein K1X78_27945 [Verrucomicrobiaceae bacterium]|nr:hypothetical protein [Verrucomicrobiaceae bacterium]